MNHTWHSEGGAHFSSMSATEVSISQRDKLVAFKEPGRTVDGEEMVDEDVVPKSKEEEFWEAEPAWPH